MLSLETFLQFMDASFIVFLCFLIFMFFSLKFGYKKAISAMDNQIAEIKKTLEQAQDKFLTAQERLLLTKTAQAQLSLEVEKLTEEATHHIETMKSQSEAEIINLIESRQATADQMIDQIRLKIINDLKITLSSQIQAVLEDVMVHRLDAKTHEQLNQDAIDKLTLALKDQRETTEKKMELGASRIDSTSAEDRQGAPLLANGF